MTDRDVLPVCRPLGVLSTNGGKRRIATTPDSATWKIISLLRARRELVGALAIHVIMVASLTSAATAFAEDLVVRSGNGVLGGTDRDLRVLAKEGKAPTADQLLAAHRAPRAFVIRPNPAWIPNLVCDREAKWVSLRANAASPASAIYAIDIEVSEPFTTASMTLCYAADDGLGGGVYLNGWRIPKTNGSGSYRSAQAVGPVDVASALHPGVNTIYFHVSDTDWEGGASGLIFRATVHTVEVQRTPAERIQLYVQEKINQWQKKGEFEKTPDYAERLKERPEKIHAFTEEAIAQFKDKFVRRIDTTAWSLKDYDADHETFEMLTPEFGRIVFPLPIAQATAFKSAWNGLTLQNVDTVIRNGSWVLSFAVFADPANGKHYIYDGSTSAGYDAQSEFTFNFEPLQFAEGVSEARATSTEAPKFDDYSVDKDLPHTRMSNPDAIAVVIGNSKYQKTKSVAFATQDALAMKRYLVEVLGYKEGNVFFLTNASKGDFDLYFGTTENPRGKLYNAMKPERSDVFIYYSGHGAPGLKDKTGYFVPVECDPNYVELQGYPLDTFYNNLAQLPARSVSVVLDACFSGATVFEGVSPITVRVEQPARLLRNTVVLASSSGGQVSSWYEGKQHGMLTYFFLKGIHSKTADVNHDGKVTFKEIFDYVADKSEGVPYWARRIHGVEQDPTLAGSNAQKVLVEY